MVTDQLSARDVAELTGLSLGTIYTYRKRGTIPTPDGQIMDVHWWYRSTIDQWLATRPKRGQRGPGRKGQT